MTSKETPIQQQIINKINAKVDFTYPLKTKRYIVGIKELHKSKNPSLQYDDIYKDVYGFVNDSKANATIGGWLDKGLYYVDEGFSIDNLYKAVTIAERHGQLAIYDTKEEKVINIK